MKPAASRPPKWVAVKRGDGTITGYIEMFWAPHGWVTIPGASRWKDAL
jgi:hypothetical protein